ncbi:hypothetical protein DVH05_026327 [Phytophthora capsici]|nr:hypothetical protein DVH05_026327 [Phytophthora capsici]
MAGLTEDDADDLSEAYDREMNRIRRARRDKEEGEAKFSHLQDRSRTYRKRVEKHLASVSLLAANFQAKQRESSIRARRGTCQAEKVFKESESKGPCATYEEFKESGKQRRSDA